MVSGAACGMEDCSASRELRNRLQPLSPDSPIRFTQIQLSNLETTVLRGRDQTRVCNIIWVIVVAHGHAPNRETPALGTLRHCGRHDSALLCAARCGAYQRASVLAVDQNRDREVVAVRNQLLIQIAGVDRGQDLVCNDWHCGDFRDGMINKDAESMVSGKTNNP
jgi:hypothetical protein